MDPELSKVVDAVVDGVARQLQKKPLPVDAEYLSISTAAQLTDFTEKALRDKISLGIGPRTLRIGRSIRIKRNDLMSWAEGQGGAS